MNDLLAFSASRCLRHDDRESRVEHLVDAGDGSSVEEVLARPCMGGRPHLGDFQRSLHRARWLRRWRGGSSIPCR